MDGSRGSQGAGLAFQTHSLLAEKECGEERRSERRGRNKKPGGSFSVVGVEGGGEVRGGEGQERRKRSAAGRKSVSGQGSLVDPEYFALVLFYFHLTMNTTDDR